MAVSTAPIFLPNRSPAQAELGEGSLTILLVAAELFAALMVALFAFGVRRARPSAPVPGCAVEGASGSRGARRLRARAIASLRPSPVAALHPGTLSAIVGKIVPVPPTEPSSDQGTVSVWAPVRGSGHVFVADEAGDVIRVDLRGQVTGKFRIGDEVFAAGALVEGPPARSQPGTPPFRAHQPSDRAPVLGPGPQGDFVLICGTQDDAVAALSPRLFPDAVWMLRALSVALVMAAVVSGCTGILDAAQARR